MKYYFIRFLLATIILAALFIYVDTVALLNILNNTNILFFILLVLFSAVLIWMSSLKWQLFVNASGSKVGILRLMNLYTIGYFFNSFMPAYIGGDIVRSLKLGTHLSGKLDAFLATFMERFTGLLAMVMLGVLFVAFGSRATIGLEFSVIFVAAGTLVFSLLIFSTHGSNIIRKIGAKSAYYFAKETGRSLYLSQFERIRKGILTLGSHPKLFFKALGYSFIFHGLTVVNTYIACRAVGVINPDWSGLFIVVPLVLIISMVPITPSGLGIQEGAFLFLLQRIGIPAEQALSVGLILRVKVVIIALLGGGLLLFSSQEQKSATEKIHGI